MPTVLPMVRFSQPKRSGQGTLYNADSDLVHHQHRLSVVQWNTGPARKNPRFLRRPVVGFTQPPFKKPVIMPHESRTSSSRAQAAQTLPSCSAGTHLSPMLQSLPSRVFVKQGHFGKGSSCGSRALATPFPFLYLHGYFPCSVLDHNVAAKNAMLDSA